MIGNEGKCKKCVKSICIFVQFEVDMGWNTKGSRRTYNSATGTLMETGVKSRNICDSQTFCKRCHKCNMLLYVRYKKGNALSAKKPLKVKKYTLKEDKLANHKFMRNWSKSSKSMESEAIVRLVFNAQKKSGMYVRGLVMDDDTTTPARLGEDTVPDSKYRLPKHLTRMNILADPSHCKRTWQNRYYKLAALKKKKCNVDKAEAKKMGNDIVYWIFQANEITFE